MYFELHVVIDYLAWRSRRSMSQSSIQTEDPIGRKHIESLTTGTVYIVDEGICGGKNPDFLVCVCVGGVGGGGGLPPTKL